MTSSSSQTTRRDLRRSASVSSSSASRRFVRPAALTLGLAMGLTAVVGTTASAALPTASGPAPVMQRAALVTAAATSTAKPLSAIEQATSDAVAAAEASVVEAATVTGDVSAAALPIEGDTTIDTTQLRERIEGLKDTEVIPTLLLPDLTDKLTDATDDVQAETADLRGRLEAAQAQKAAEEEAARIAAEEAAAAEAAAKAKAEDEAAAAAAQRSSGSRSSSSSSSSSSAPAASAVASTGDNSPGAAQQAASNMLGEFGWGQDQFSCLVSLWNKESGWNYQAYNSGSGAYGIPQALPGSKMASAGGDWQTNAVTQVRWGLGYISGRYGSPCGAWGHSQSVGWY
ncbi:lytic transglycosylase domain-containing protein [Microbacterium sp. BDGP8]|uniref:aggregation-promoting factor C-terminal-like domain-containing protein n=1 Tax=unclassified Microbacterium TaxID=2609290 RepID=UPI00249E4BC4|nr:lytic transglycosylase domain-containing protein [Microbacterium sp. BDGP8]WHE36800.1 lytic transglycosylase domain-containing protein [Microbacterium sp. BDGP8]